MKLPLVHRALFFLVLSASTSLVFAQAQDYQDYGDYGDNEDYYQQDTLYQDYAQHQEWKAQGGGGGLLNAKTVALAAASWFLGGKIHSKRALKKTTQKHKSVMKEFYTKYSSDVTMLQSQILELSKFIRESAKQQLTDEFLRADVDDNGLVSRAEFERHKREYLAKHPEYNTPGMFPNFEDFDPDGNGMITVREHEAYYEQRGML